MAMTRWDPFAGTLPLREAMNRLFEESFIRPDGAWLAGSVPLDVYAEGDNYVLEVAVPGLVPESIDATVLGSQVTIRGEYPTSPEGRQYLLRERGSGRFERTVTLGAELDADKVEARYEHGVLRLVIPKAESAKPKRIAIANGKAQPALAGAK
jgi:HSP20 family protein